MTDDPIDTHKEFLLDRLRVATLRCRLMENELLSIGTALRHDMIGPDMAVRWAHDMGVLWLIEPLPGTVGAVAIASITEPKDAGTGVGGGG